MVHDKEPRNILDRIDRALVLFSAACMFIIMLIVIADVLLRYALHMPLAWSYDVISLYLMVGMFFFAISDTLRVGGHVGIDVFQPYLPSTVRHVGEAIGYLAAAFLTGMMAQLAFFRGLSAWQNEEMLSGAYLWPTWIAQVPVVVGTAMIALRCLLLAATHVRDIFDKSRADADMTTPSLEEPI
ncbi:MULTISPECIES: TRAP transporter small permease [unclassified Xanthobacter]|uniref:TRAP transporter small permease n=1 Tax=unclassified Xanthobacter TaxID=2623496 RepID=UPI001EDFAB8F|nr:MULTISPECIES: TRAP transporter small permease [unclassified Xanthobacter]